MLARLQNCTSGEVVIRKRDGVRQVPLLQQVLHHPAPRSHRLLLCCADDANATTGLGCGGHESALSLVRTKVTLDPTVYVHQVAVAALLQVREHRPPRLGVVKPDLDELGTARRAVPNFDHWHAIGLGAAHHLHGSWCVVPSGDDERRRSPAQHRPNLMLLAL